MPILSPIGRRSLKVRALIAAIYLALAAGAITMIYPFLLMVAGSTKSAVDAPESKLVPPFLLDDIELYRKYVEGLFNEKLDLMQSTYDTDAASFRLLDPPEAARAPLVDAWLAFLEQAPSDPHAFGVGFLHAPVSRGVQPSGLRAFKQRMMAGYGDDVSALNEAAGTRFVNWNAFYVLPRDFLVRAGQPDAGLFSRAVDAFQADQPVTARYYFSPEGFFKNGYLKTRYGKDLAGYNREHGTAHASWSSVILDAEAPAGSGRTELERADWELFVRSILNLLWIRAAPEAAPLYRDYLRAKYGTLENLNRRSAARYESFDHVDFPEIPPETGIARTDWEAFLQGWEDPANGRLHLLPAEQIRIDSMETRFRRHLQQEFDSLDSLNARLGTAFSDWNQIRPPQAETHYRAFRDQRTALRVEFALRNYYSVLDYLVLHGRGLVNTAIYCLLAILSALIVNPLAAYALSRFRPPSTYRVLLFLMLTMSFPPMVTQIPVFLMLREFNLLNTFWALILPGLANGYSIFLLKGFFDSLPRELYESADMDGAGELRMFWHITMSLSTPILAVIALQAFTHAYANFMMALLICQEEKMWTLMPWLYQLQQRSGPGIIYASLVIAAAPTFLVFAICQKIILRGIVVPVEK